VVFIPRRGEHGAKGLTAEGLLPDSLAAIRTEMETAQIAEGGEKADVDYIFEIPLRVAKSIVGFKHDERCDHMPENQFHVMSRATVNQGFFRRFFGRK
jgi:hypothetical protein